MWWRRVERDVEPVSVLPRLERAGSTSRSSRRSARTCRSPATAYQRPVLPPEARQDLCSSAAACAALAPAERRLLTDEHSLRPIGTSVATGGLEADATAEAHLDPESIFAGVTRFARDRAKRLEEQRSLLKALG